MANIMNTTQTDGKAKIGVLGGDRRQIAMAEVLAASGYEVALAGFERYDGEICLPTRCIGTEGAVRGAAAVILPLPYSQDHVRLHAPYADGDILLDDMFAQLKPTQMVLGGRFHETAHALAKRAGVTVYDYSEREAFCIANAVPTAEGAVAIAMERLPVTLHGSRCTVIGYGRIGRILCRLLASFGAHVTATARKPADLAWIRAEGYRAMDTRQLSFCESRPDVIFNTVPNPVLTADLLEQLGESTLVVDLASRPGGVDRIAAQRLGVPTVWALSLPGKTSPVTAGRIAARSVLGILREEGVTT